MNESMILEDSQGKTSKRLGLIKMNILDNEKKESINKLVHKHIDPDAVLFTDKSKSYVDLKRFVQNHIQEISPNIIENKKSTPTGMIVALVAVVAVAAFFAGSYFSNLDSDVVTQSELNDAISKLESKIGSAQQAPSQSLKVLGNLTGPEFFNPRKLPNPEGENTKGDNTGVNSAPRPKQKIKLNQYIAPETLNQDF